MRLRGQSLDRRHGISVSDVSYCSGRMRRLRDIQLDGRTPRGSTTGRGRPATDDDVGGIVLPVLDARVAPYR